MQVYSIIYIIYKVSMFLVQICKLFEPCMLNKHISFALELIATMFKLPVHYYIIR